MDRLDWNESFRIGVERIDEQHRKLFALRNQLLDCCCRENSVHAEDFHRILSELFEYTRYHFEAEEEFMQAIAYPKLDAHHKCHDQFIDNLVNFSLDAANSTKTHREVLDFLTVWLINHVLKSDMDIRRYIESNPGLLS